MTVPLCVFHKSDLDGYCSAAIVKKFYPKAELYGYDYGDDNDKLLAAAKGRDVIMVDASLQPFETMHMLLNGAASLTWIDHHIGVLEWAEKARFNPKGLRRDGTAGCELTWEYFYEKETLPRAVYLLGRYDVFDTKSKEWSSIIEPFQWGMRSIRAAPDASFWGTLLQPKDKAEPALVDIIDRGVVVQEYQELQDEKAAKGLAFETEIDGHAAIAANSGGKGSPFFKSVYDPDKHDLMLTFFWSKKGFWTVGLYTTHEEVNCCKIAEKHGGSGHAGAAGFQCDELPFAKAPARED